MDVACIQVTHKACLRAERPGLGEVGLQLQELRIRVLEEFLVFLVERLSPYDIVE